MKVFRKGVVEDQHQRNDRKKKEPGTPGVLCGEKSMGDVLKILIECSFDNLFVLTGLVFMGIAVVGDIWKIQPGKWGRLGSAALSPILICTGLWMHAHQHAAITQFKVVRLDFQAASNAYDGMCPMELRFPAQVEANGPGKVRYEVEYSDGVKTSPLELDFDRPETKRIKISRQFSQTRDDAWVKVNILSPDHNETEKARFTVTCQSAVVRKVRSNRGKNAEVTSLPVPQAENLSSRLR